MASRVKVFPEGPSHSDSSLPRASNLEAPWSATNRLNEQRTGAFSWRPVLRSSWKNRPIQTRPYPEPQIWKALWPGSGVIRVSPRTQVVLRNLSTCHQPSKLCPACLLTTTSTSSPNLPTIAMTKYTHAVTIINSSSSKSSSSVSGGHI